MAFTSLIIQALANVFPSATDFIKSIREVCANGDRLDNQNNIKTGQAVAVLVFLSSVCSRLSTQLLNFHGRNDFFFFPTRQRAPQINSLREVSGI